LKETETKKNRLDFSVFPLWDFLGDTYGMEEAFKVFGPYRGANIIPKIINKNTRKNLMLHIRLIPNFQIYDWVLEPLMTIFSSWEVGFDAFTPIYRTL
jgi:hypothetical protein